MLEIHEADPALIFASDREGPGTHVLLIGIGEYDHLIDGVKEKLELADGMEQLDAPPQSVKALADWFLDGNFVNDERPLASLAMVVSTPEPYRYEHAAATIPNADLPDGSTETVLAAIRAWLSRASSSEESQTIFYFCGHGVLSGTQTLLCRDFGAVTEDPFDQSVNFEKFHAAMATKIPEYQIFLVDACRTSDSVVDMTTQLGGVGRRVLNGSSIKARGGTPARQSIHLATSDLAKSWGRVNGLSLYAEALLRALSGGGAQRDLDMWVGTDGLQTALGTYTARLAKAAGVEQEPDRIKSGRFKIHKPARVQVPVYLTCNPLEAWGSKFTLTTQRDGGDARSHEHDPGSKPDAREMEILLDPDKYSFHAIFGDDAPFTEGNGTTMVFPPEVPFDLSITRRLP
ncbi:hypothetical protein HMP09_1914 [Sphingomonas sp. HMP9]|uniref:caspase family protein n=1 Tax=Sphingomonas sp. HMP9 TaxID=1517554 RepID=UPI001596B46B|nr:caspase family protein [Sphingomonas sp. HMP9]BCA62680.1 hypothetical protein HMP09_1914 [Sphingomonas sp. HMP9]